MEGVSSHPFTRSSAGTVKLMQFVLNGRAHTLDAETVRARVPGVPPDAIRTHWVEIDGRRWPPKQAFRVATGITDEPFISHFAVRLFRRLGFQTSPLPNINRPVIKPHDLGPDSTRDEDGIGAAAFEMLDRFLSTESLTAKIARLEATIDGADAAAAEQVLESSGFDGDLVDSALIVRERVGMLDTLIHAAVIMQVLPIILGPGEVVSKRPSLGAGNDPGRVFDLETNQRVAEFKLSSWKGADSMRQRGLFADVVGLSMDTSGRRREVYVVGALPVRFLTTSNRNAARTLSKAALKLRGPQGLTDQMTVAEYTRNAGVQVVDLTNLVPKLR